MNVAANLDRQAVGFVEFDLQLTACGNEWIHRLVEAVNLCVVSDLVLVTQDDRLFRP